MEHLLLKAATTAADQGIFEAVISTATADREKDVVNPEGMVRALHKWNRNIPLAWNHSSKAEDQIGYVDPRSARVDGNEVVVQGYIDQATEVGAHAWRQVKNGTLGFSFGYLILAGSNRKGGGRNIDELDVFEVTATPTPMNNDTRVLSFKSVEGADEYPVEELEMALKAVWTTAYIDSLPDSAFLYVEGDTRKFPYKDADGNVDLPHLRNALSRIPQSNLSQDVKDRLTAKAQRILNDSSKSADATDQETKSRSVDPLIAEANALALEFASGGMSLIKPPRQEKAEPKPELPSTAELTRAWYRMTCEAITGEPIDG